MRRDIGNNGALEFIFDRKGVFTIEYSNINIHIDELEMELIDGGLEELDVDKEFITLYCDFTDFNNMQKKNRGVRNRD